jgi:hypothetical protein
VKIISYVVILNKKIKWSFSFKKKYLNDVKENTMFLKEKVWKEFTLPLADSSFSHFTRHSHIFKY